MTSGKSENRPPDRARRPVRAPYTFANLKDDLRHEYSAMGAKKSLRAIANNRGVSHAAVQRVLAGIEPKRPDIRKAFKLTDMAPAPVCQKCGVVHVSRRCTKRKPSRKSLFDWPVSELASAIRNRR